MMIDRYTHDNERHASENYKSSYWTHGSGMLRPLSTLAFELFQIITKLPIQGRFTSTTYGLHFHFVPSMSFYF